MPHDPSLRQTHVAGALSRRGIGPVIAERNTEHGSGLGIFRWVVERTIRWLPQFRRLRIRYKHRADNLPRLTSPRKSRLLKRFEEKALFCR